MTAVAFENAQKLISKLEKIAQSGSLDQDNLERVQKDFYSYSDTVTSSSPASHLQLAFELQSLLDIVQDQRDMLNQDLAQAISYAKGANNLYSSVLKKYVAKASLKEKQNIPHFFTVSTVRMVVLGLITLGAYGIYWSYKNWKAVEAKLSELGGKKKRIHPILSSIFFPLTSYELFLRVKDAQKAMGMNSEDIKPGNIAWGVFLLNIIGLSFIPVAVSQKYMNSVKLKAFGNEEVRKGTSGGEIVMVILLTLLVWGRIAESANSSAANSSFTSPQITQKKSEVDSLTSQYNQCSTDVEAKRSGVDGTDQAAVDAFNAGLQTCDNIRLQQNKAVDEYNSLISNK